MLVNIFKSIFGSRNDRIIKKYRKLVRKINALEANLINLSDEALKEKTNEFKTRYTQGQDLDSMLPEAFAVCREASRRIMNMRHFDVQLMGGIALHNGEISEMRTGEGKTLMATLPAYLNAISGKGVHIVTVNDYLAERDAKWMGKLFNFLNLSVGVNIPNLTNPLKQQAYNADITYGTNNEFGFDYLRDNMVYSLEDKVQRGLNFAIVDEVDSILIDEARTPLIISGLAEDHTELYRKINGVPSLLTRQIGEEKSDGTGIEKIGDFVIDEKNNQVFLTEQGYEKAEKILEGMGLIQANDSLYSAHNISLMHHIYAALRAHNLYNKDQHYVVQNNEVIIVDEFTGRLMQGRRWSDGLHQAVEAKENAEIQAENQTLASITFQNYFRMYEKLAGMTGTADTEAYEFQEIYGLETIIIPPNKLSNRTDYQDQIFKTSAEKYRAVIKDIQTCYEKGQPVLVGTTSIENSEYVSSLLNKENLPHQVLNAKQHEQEAKIIAQAGKEKVITIATNMAGRGTDIVLGGNSEKNIEEINNETNLTNIEKQQKIDAINKQWHQDNAHIKKLGGLHIIATERHESRRIDNQLRGRSGRQGDNGSSRFYLSLDDDLMRIFGGEKLQTIFTRLKMPENEPIEARMISRSIEGAQRKVEGRNFDIRKQLLQYDDVANEQRREIYAFRNKVLSIDSLGAIVNETIESVVQHKVQEFIPANSIEQEWNISELQTQINECNLNINLEKYISDSKSITSDDILDLVNKDVLQSYKNKVELAGKEAFDNFEKNIILTAIDQYWREHLANLEHLRQGISLRGYAQKDPKQEYKKEAFELFNQMLYDIKTKLVTSILQVQIQQPEPIEEKLLDLPAFSNPSFGSNKISDISLANEQSAQVENLANVGRNEPCPCGSGKRYKNCHGKLD